MRIRLMASAACLLSASVAMQACNKKKKASTTTTTAAGDTATTTPNDVDSAVVTTSTSSLKLAGSLNLIVSGDGASLNLADIGGDYATDKGHFNTDDKSLESLGTVQMILCFLAATGYTDEHVVNKGKYIAMVDMGNCDKSSGGGGGGDSSSKKVQMTAVTVDSVRAEKKPLTAKVWFDMAQGGGGGDEGGGGGGNQRIAMSIAVAEGPGDGNPLGIFRMNFIMGSVVDSKFTETGHGWMESKRDSSGAVVLNFVEKSEESSGSSSRKNDTAVGIKISVENGKVVGGWANMHDYQLEKGGKGGDRENKNDYRLAFDRSLFAAHDVNANKDSCRSQSDFNMNVWRYGVYDLPSGNRVTMKGGFGFTYGSGKRGWASYHGISGDVGATIADGTTVTKQNFGSKGGAAETYTVKVGKGKLTKHTRHDLKLDDLAGIDIEAGSNDGTMKRIVWNKTLQKFQVTGTATSRNFPITWTDSAAADYTPANGFNNYSSNALGGRVDIAFDTSKQATGAAYYEDQDVTATAGTISLYCWQNCIKPNLKSTDLSTSGGGGGAQSAPGYLYTASTTNPYAPFDLASPKVYTFSSDKLVLSDADGTIALASGQTITQGTMAPSMDLVDAAAKATITDVMKARQQTVTYTWSIGDPANPWSAYQGLIGSDGKPVSFDPPRVISYTHSAANDATGATSSPTFGKTLRIQYDGSNLQIPGHQDKDSGYYVADFAIKEGVKSDDGTIVFKPLDGSKYMKSKDASACAGLDVGKAPSLPDASLYDDTKANHDAPPDATSLPIQVVDGVYAGG